MCQMRNAGHLNFHRHGNLAFDLLGRTSGPLRNDLDIVVCDIWIGFVRQAAKGYNAPCGKDEGSTENKPAVFERKIDECANHYWFPAVSSIRALLTTRCPGSIPERIT